MSCLTDTLAANIAVNCDYLSIAGIESDVVIIPKANIDRTASTFDAANRMLMTNLQCKSGTSGFKIEGIKQLQGYNQEFVPSDDSLDRYRHVFEGVIMTPSAENRLQASKLAKGEAYVVVINKKYKGENDEDAFVVLGWDSGLYVTALTENSRENDAAIRFTLSSKDISLEYDAIRNLLQTDYATTLADFDTQFAEA